MRAGRAAGVTAARVCVCVRVCLTLVCKGAPSCPRTPFGRAHLDPRLFLLRAVNIVRDVRWGRAQETYGEDPTLTGTLGAMYVRGMQQPNGTGPLAVRNVAKRELPRPRLPWDRRTIRTIVATVRSPGMFECCPHFSKMYGINLMSSVRTAPRSGLAC